MGSSRALFSRLSPLWWVILASVSAWSIVLFAVPPSQQNFPLIDDWAFGRGAVLFAGGQGIHYSNWASMPQLGQWLWACPFLWLFGSSFFTLRLSTIVLSWLGLTAFYDLLRLQDWSPGRAALAAGVLAVHPLFFLLQGTFMTDVPALSFSFIALTFYVRALREQRTIWWLGALAVALLAVLTRQNSVVVPMIAGFLLARQPSMRRRFHLWLYMLIPIVVGISVHVWIQQRPDIIVIDPRPLPPASLVLLPFVMVHWCGLSILPLLWFVPVISSWRTFLVALLILASSAAYWFYHRRDLIELDALFPYTGAILSSYGAGGAGLYVGARPITLQLPLRILLTVLGCFGGAVFVDRVRTWDFGRLASCPLFLFAISQVFFIFIAPDVWDRYLLPVVLPGALVLAGTPSPRNSSLTPGTWRWAATLVLASLLAAASVVLMHDWLAWNAAWWQLGRRAVAQKINPLDIDGGLEWDGWHCAPYQPPERRNWREIMGPIMARKAGPSKRLTAPTTRVWFPQISGRFALAFSPVAGGRVLDSQPYHLWLRPSEPRIYLLEYVGPEWQPSTPSAPIKTSPPPSRARNPGIRSDRSQDARKR